MEVLIWHHLESHAFPAPDNKEFDSWSREGNCRKEQRCQTPKPFSQWSGMPGAQ